MNHKNTNVKVWDLKSTWVSTNYEGHVWTKIEPIIDIDWYFPEERKLGWVLKKIIFWLTEELAGKDCE